MINSGKELAMLAWLGIVMILLVYGTTLLTVVIGGVLFGAVIYFIYIVAIRAHLSVMGYTITRRGK